MAARSDANNKIRAIGFFNKVRFWNAKINIKIMPAKQPIIEHILKPFATI